MAVEECWSTREVARMSGATSRALRYWDRIGLLVPAWVDASGQRWYGRRELLRLQGILLLRHLGMPLVDVARALDGEADQVELLDQHERRLREERDRISTLLSTVAATRASLDLDQDLPVQALFTGFEARLDDLEATLTAHFGPGIGAHFAEARERAAGETLWDRLDAWCEHEDLDGEAVALLTQEVAADDPRAQELGGRYVAAVAKRWTPDASSLAGLGRAMVEVPQLRIRCDARHADLAAYLCDLLTTYATTRMTTEGPTP